MKKKIKNIKNIINPIIVAIVLILCISMVSAVPSIPESYEGQAFLNGEPVLGEVVITVESFTDGELFGTAILHPEVGPGVYELYVNIDDLETPEREGAIPGEQLTWKINDLICDTPQEGYDIAEPGKPNTNFTLNAYSSFAITNFTPSSPVNDIEGETGTFTVTFNQNVNVTWYLNGVVEKDNEKEVSQATYTNTSASIGTWNISAVAANTNGEVVQTWIWNVSGADATPVIIFTDPTPADGAILTQNHAYINTSVSNSLTAFIDWNNSLTGWLRFNNENGENSTFFKDWSSWGNNVNCSGTNCPTSTSGKFGNALSFDGSNDYIFTTSSTGISDTSTFTIESWINVKNDSHWMDIIRKEGSWALQIGPNQEVGFEITGKQDILTNIVVPVNGWTHLAVTFEKNTVNFYKDGILKDTKNMINESDPGSNSIYIGGYSFGSTYFNGMIDEIKIHSRVLGPEEIKASYDAETNILSRNFANLTHGIYHYKAYTQNQLGTIDQTEIRTVTLTSQGAPTITEFTPISPVNNTQNQSQTFSITVDQIVNVTWHLNSVVVKDNEAGVTQATYTNASAFTGIWNVTATATNANGTVSQEWTWNVNSQSPPIAPSIISFTPLSPVNDTEGQSRIFNITLDQIVDVTWYLNGVVITNTTVNSVTQATYTNDSATAGTWIVNATATNANGTVSQEWTWNVNSQSLPGGLSAYWKFDENSGTTALDSSENNNTGSVYGPTWTTGQIGSALQFDGVDDYVDVGNTLNLEEGFTILMWVKRDAGSSTWRTLISKGEDTQDHYHNYVVYFNPSNELEFSFGDGINHRTFETNNAYDTNWHHLAVSFVSSTDMQVYVDGVLQPGRYDPNGKAIEPATNSCKTLIGASSITTEFFKGVIDEIKIYNRVLTEEEIKLDYSSG